MKSVPSVPFLRRRRQLGQMSIEFVAVIGLVAIVLAGMVYFLGLGRTSTKVTDAVSGFTSMFNKAQSLYSNDPSGFTNITVQALLDNGAVPAKMAAGSAINSPLGGAVTVTSSTVYGGAAGSGATFTAQNVPSAACSDFVNGIAPAVANLKVGTTDVRTNGSNVAGYVAALGSACKADTVSVAMTIGR